MLLLVEFQCFSALSVLPSPSLLFIWQHHPLACTSCQWLQADLPHSTPAGTSSLPWSSPQGFGWQSSHLYQELSAEPAVADLPEASTGEASLGEQMTAFA